MQTLDQEVVTGIVEELLGHPADHIEAFKPPSGGLGHYRNDPEGAKQAAALVRTAIQAGKLRVEGSQAKGPKVLAGFHDALAEITA